MGIGALGDQGHDLGREYLDQQNEDRQDGKDKAHQRRDDAPQFPFAAQCDDVAENGHEGAVDMPANQQVVDGFGHDDGDLQGVGCAGRAEEVSDDGFARQAQDAAADIAKGKDAAGAGDAGVGALLISGRLAVDGGRGLVRHHLVTFDGS